MREITQQGINALKSGDRAAAFQLLANAVRQDPDDVQAWLWLSGAVDSDKARIDCMRQVLRIEPGNPAAAQGLAQLLKKQGSMEEPPGKAVLTPVRSTAAPTPSMGERAAGAAVQEPAVQEPAVQPLEEDRPTQVPPIPAPPATAQPQGAKVYPDIDAMRAVYEQPSTMSAPAAAPDELAAPEELAAEQVAESFSQDVGEQMPPDRVENIAELAPGKPFYRPMARPEVTYTNYEQKVVFKTRPSHVPALISFWIFFFGAYFVGAQFTDPDYLLGAAIGFGLGLALELVIIYIIITNFRTRYTLTNQELRMHIIISEGGLPYGRTITIPLNDIYTAECRQNFLQQMMGIGDLHFDAAVKGQLAHMRLRGIPHCDRCAQQLLYLIRDQQPSNIFTREVS